MKGRRPFHALVVTLLTSCTSGQSASVPAIVPVNVAQTATLQFAVGTATFGTGTAGVPNGGSKTILNVVATFRSPNGNNATSVNTPTITAPAGVNFGPLLGNSNVLGGETPLQFSQLAAHLKNQPVGYNILADPLYEADAQGFGPFVGVFGYGLAADNLISNTDTENVTNRGTAIGLQYVCEGIATGYYPLGFYGSAPLFGSAPNGAPIAPSDAVRSAELEQPVPDGAGTISPACADSSPQPGSTLADQNYPQQFFGGPPAWPSPQGFGIPAYFIGFPLGFTAFDVTPVTGSYGLSVTFPTSANDTVSGTLATKAALTNAGQVLAPIPQAALQINTSDGSGSITITAPATALESVIDVAATSCDYVGHPGAINHYSIVTHSPGQQTLFLSGSLGPPNAAGQPTHTFCTPSDVATYNAATATTGAAPQSQLFESVTVVAIGADYPLYESSYPFNTTAGPPITNGNGHTGQADVSVSYPLILSLEVPAPAGG